MWNDDCHDMVRTLDPPPSLVCGAADRRQAETMLHEFTHLENVHFPSCADHAYHHDIHDLNATMALLNADTYSQYASAVYDKCGEAKSKDLDNAAAMARVGSVVYIVPFLAWLSAFAIFFR